jgi:hypothetical protein
MIDDPPARFELLKEIRRKVLETRCWEADTDLHYISNGVPFNFRLRADLVRNCLDRAFEAAFAHLETKIKHSRKNTIFVVHGGSALHPWAKEKLLEIGRQSLFTTKLVYHDMIETSSGGKRIRLDRDSGQGEITLG